MSFDDEYDRVTARLAEIASVERWLVERGHDAREHGIDWLGDLLLGTAAHVAGVDWMSGLPWPHMIDDAEREGQ